MSLPRFADPRNQALVWTGAGLCAFAIFSLVAAGQPAAAAGIIALALVGVFVYFLRHELALRSLTFIAVGTAGYLVAWNRGVPFLYACSAAAFALVVVSHLLPRWVLRPVQGRINCPSSILQGETAELAIAVENPGHVSLRLLELEVPVAGAVTDAPPARALLIHLGPRASQRLSTRTPPLRRGCHAVGPLTVSTGFPLGLVTKSLRVEGSGRSLWVYPKLFPVEFLPIAGERFQQMGEAISPRTGGTDDFAGVREYRHGDSRRTIHWRASARHGHLVVKEFMRTAATTVTIALDLGRARNIGQGIDTAGEDAIRIAGSVARYALTQRHHVQLLLCGASVERVGPVENLGDFDALLRALALAQFDGEQTFGSHLERIVGMTPRESTAVLVYADAGDTALGAIESLRRNGVLVVPVAVEAASYYPQATTRQSTAEPRLRARVRRAARGSDLAALFRQ